MFEMICLKSTVIKYNIYYNIIYKYYNGQIIHITGGILCINTGKFAHSLFINSL